MILSLLLIFGLYKKPLYLQARQTILQMDMSNAIFS